MEHNPLKTLGMHAGAKPEIFRFAEKLRVKMTPPEIKLWGFLKSSPEGFKFRRQHPFGGYVLDFYCHQKRLAIEIDGKSHDNPNQKEYDKIRTEFIESLEVQEIRFTNEEVLLSFDEIKNNLLKVILSKTS